MLLSVLSPFSAGLLLQAGACGLDIAISAARFLSSHETTQLWLPSPPVYAFLLYYAALFIAAFAGSERRYIAVSTAMSAAALIIFVLPAFGVPLRTTDGWRVTVLDVGHGSAGFIEMSGGRTILVDGGSRSGPGYDCGEKIIAPFLWQRGLGRIDDIIITHDDADHYSGIGTIIRMFRPARLIVPDESAPKKGLRGIMRLARSYGVETVFPTQDMSIRHGHEKLEIFLAEKHGSSTYDPIQSSEDDRGLVVKFSTANFSMLFPGDITARKERELAGRLEVASTVLLSPHHGSSSSNTLDFLGSVAPDVMIFSANDHGSGLFPSMVARKNAQRLSIDTLTTSRDGTVTLTGTHQSTYRIDTFSRADQRFFRTG